MWRYFKSAAGALFGVQSESVRQSDFSQRRILPFVIAGVLLIAIFVAVLIGIVHWVLAGS
ncbi:DUF2970 domain-containing protein [Neiella marina]|uniref:DUF2970 domain-containing protein n=1 Tax=Neiella holothuriorum TaxID=2870530 RepID=A0ABS7ECF8_9GAMM|nr:DUF2970 domain-containing protein [Neiella holothuriorum]MBW8190014.1 DUF2970 domain-containing protein [Neiella holothuriorum]